MNNRSLYINKFIFTVLFNLLIFSTISAQQNIVNLEFENDKLTTQIEKINNNEKMEISKVNEEISPLYDSLKILNEIFTKQKKHETQLKKTITTYDISIAQSNAYNRLSEQIFFIETASGLQKIENFKSKLCKEGLINEKTNILITKQNNYWYNINGTDNNRLISLNELILSEKEIKALKKLKKKGGLQQIGSNKNKLEIQFNSNFD